MAKLKQDEIGKVIKELREMSEEKVRSVLSGEKATSYFFCLICDDQLTNQYLQGSEMNKINPKLFERVINFEGFNSQIAERVLIALTKAYSSRDTFSANLDAIGAEGILKLIRHIKFEVTDKTFPKILQIALKMDGLKNHRTEIIARVFLSQSPWSFVSNVVNVMKQSCSEEEQIAVLQFILDLTLDESLVKKLANVMHLIYQTPNYDQFVDHCTTLQLDTPPYKIFELQLKSFFHCYQKSTKVLVTLLGHGLVQFVALTDKLTKKHSLQEIAQNTALFEIYARYCAPALQETDSTKTCMFDVLLQNKDSHKLGELILYWLVLRNGLSDEVQQDKFREIIKQYTNFAFSDTNPANMVVLKKIAVLHARLAQAILVNPTLSNEQIATILYTRPSVGTSILHVIVTNKDLDVRNELLKQLHKQLENHARCDFGKLDVELDRESLAVLVSISGQTFFIALENPTLPDQEKIHLVQSVVAFATQEQDKNRRQIMVAGVLAKTPLDLLNQLDNNTKKSLRAYQSNVLVTQLEAIQYPSLDLVGNRSNYEMVCLLINFHYIHTPLVRALYMQVMGVQNQEQMQGTAVKLQDLYRFVQKTSNAYVVGYLEQNAAITAENGYAKLGQAKPQPQLQAQQQNGLATPSLNKRHKPGY